MKFNRSLYFNFYSVVRDIPQLPTWLMADRAVSKFERLMSLYYVHMENILSTDGPFFAMQFLELVLIDVLSEICDLQRHPSKSHSHLPPICKKLSCDFEQLYASSTFCEVKSYLQQVILSIKYRGFSSNTVFWDCRKKLFSIKWEQPNLTKSNRVKYKSLLEENPLYVVCNRIDIASSYFSSFFSNFQSCQKRYIP